MIGLLAAHSNQLPTTNIEHIVPLGCLLVPTDSVPDAAIVEKLLVAAEDPHPKGVDGLARRILCQLTGNVGETLREKSPVCGYGHPVDSSLVNMLERISEIAIKQQIWKILHLRKKLEKMRQV